MRSSQSGKSCEDFYSTRALVGGEFFNQCLNLSMIKFLLLFVVTLYSSRGFSNTSDNYYFKSVQLAGIFTSQAPGNSWSSLIRYNPYFQFKQDLKLGLSLALAPQVLSDKSRFIELEILANLRYSFHQDWDGQFSIGPQYWSCEDCGIA